MSPYRDPDPPEAQPYRRGEYKKQLDAQLAEQARKDAEPRRFKATEPIVCDTCGGAGTRKGCKLCGAKS